MLHTVYMRCNTDMFALVVKITKMCAFRKHQRHRTEHIRTDNKTNILCTGFTPAKWVMYSVCTDPVQFYARMCRCVFTNRHKAVLFAWLHSMVPLEEPQNHWFILPHSMLLSPKGHHYKKAFTINITLKIWPIRNDHHQNNLPLCVTRRQHSSM